MANDPLHDQHVNSDMAAIRTEIQATNRNVERIAALLAKITDDQEVRIRVGESDRSQITQRMLRREQESADKEVRLRTTEEERFIAHQRLSNAETVIADLALRLRMIETKTAEATGSIKFLVWASGLIGFPMLCFLVYVIGFAGAKLHT